MALVASVQRLAPLLNSVLTSERPRMHLQHRHAGLEVRRLHLREASTEGYVFTVPGGHPEGPGHILIPAAEVRRLLGKGLSGVTVIHSWFSSSVFQHTLGAPGQEPQAPDSSEETSRMQRFLSTQVGSAIISSEVWDETGEANTAVTFHLQHQAQAFPLKLVEPVCAFWNFSISPDSGGSWATTGCSVTAMYQGSTACFCNHSTNFAVLLQVYDVQRGPEEESLLRTLSFVGCGVSFCALSTTFLLFLAAGVPRSERATVHKNLTFSLASAEGFLMASEWAKANKVACLAVTAVMHLLFLVAFFWMLVEGLLLWSKVVAVSMRPGPRMPLYYATGWGVPVAIVAITLAMSPRDYVATGHCWLNHTDAIWAFVGPVLFVLTANTCILVRVVIVTVSSARRRARMLSPQPCMQQQLRIQMWATVKPVLVLLPVLGLTWLVGVLVHLSPAWAYAAVGLNSLQGPYIFLVYAAYNGEVRSALRRMTEKKAAEAFTEPMAPGSPQPSPPLQNPRDRLKGAGSSWQNLNAKAPGGGAVISKVAKGPQSQRSRRRGGPAPDGPPLSSGRGADSIQGFSFPFCKMGWRRPLQACREGAGVLQMGGVLSRQKGTLHPSLPTHHPATHLGSQPPSTRPRRRSVCGNKRAAEAPLRSSDSAFVSAEWLDSSTSWARGHGAAEGHQSIRWVEAGRQPFPMQVSGGGVGLHEKKPETQQGAESTILLSCAVTRCITSGYDLIKTLSPTRLNIPQGQEPGYLKVLLPRCLPQAASP
ncbi:PREDICTED: probable G-protein coupled receptor 144 [Bison bison bison]|uniref:Probable G-protein coupled receptor 144 n=1 Tax=Bison bison bison TaxID=43346 RepID=A0A6P3HV15_BISBB|nr:PREDICTED: probable G-protein coupled receptor 144 [Bison bison bison]